MKIVIDIPEYIYKLCQSHGDPVYGYIANGTPLPKGNVNVSDLELQRKLNYLMHKIDEAFADHGEWATGVYYALGELGFIDGWVEDREYESFNKNPVGEIEADKAESDVLDFESEEYIEQRLENYNNLLKSGILDCVKDKAEPCDDVPDTNVGDLISRQALQEWIKDKMFGDIVVASEHNFDCLPSVTPQPEKRTEERTETHACDCIDIDKAVEHYEGTLETLKGIDLEVQDGKN